MVAILGLLAACLAASPSILGDQEVEPGLRVIQLDQGVKMLLSEPEKDALIKSQINFMDVTNHPELDDKVTILADVDFPADVTEQKLVKELQEKIHRPNLFENLFRLSGFFTRYCMSKTGVESTEWLFQQIQNTIGDRLDKDITAKLFHHGWPQSSIIVHIEGTHNPEDVVVLGAHLDSINLADYYGRAPGADDNGSGTVTILETLRIIAESGFKPRNSVEFHWYSAEEIGLLGSLDVFADYSARNVSVKAMLEQDMTGSSNRYRGEKPSKIKVITDLVDPKLTKYVQLLITEYTDVGYELGQCGYACSDFYAAYSHGYPAAFAMERGNGDVEYPGFPRVGHNELDTIDRIDFTYMLEHVKLSLGYVVELGTAKL